MTDQQRTNRPEDQERGFGTDRERERDTQRAGQSDQLEQDDRNLHEGVQTHRERSRSRDQEDMIGREGRGSSGREEIDPRRSSEEGREMEGRSGRASQQADGSNQPRNVPGRSEGGYGRGSGFDEDIEQRAGGRELDDPDDLLAWDEEEENLP